MVNRQFTFGGPPVTIVLPRGHFASKRRGVTDATVQALSIHDPQFDFGHVQPGTVLGRVVNLQFLGEPSCFGFLETFTEK